MMKVTTYQRNICKEFEVGSSAPHNKALHSTIYKLVALWFRRGFTTMRLPYKLRVNAALYENRNTMTFNQAYKIVSTWVEVTTDGKAEICSVTDKPYGWVFYYQAKSHDPNDVSTFMADNAPIIFDRIDGEIRVTGTTHETEHYLKEYESALPEARLAMKPEVSGFERK